MVAVPTFVISTLYDFSGPISSWWCPSAYPSGPNHSLHGHQIIVRTG
jgi:hypothetical protein